MSHVEEMVSNLKHNREGLLLQHFLWSVVNAQD